MNLEINLCDIDPLQTRLYQITLIISSRFLLNYHALLIAYFSKIISTFSTIVTVFKLELFQR